MHPLQSQDSLPGWVSLRDSILQMSQDSHSLSIGGWSRMKEELDNESSRKTLAKMGLGRRKEMAFEPPFGPTSLAILFFRHPRSKSAPSIAQSKLAYLDGIYPCEAKPDALP